MRKIINVLLCVFCYGAVADKKSDTFTIRPFETTTLKNGLTVLWIADNSLPYISFQLMLRAGSAQDPKGKEGLANFTASMLQKGTKVHSAAQISENLEQIGSSFAAEVEPDYTLLSASALSFYKESVLNTFAEIVMQPAFTSAEIERFRKQILGSLQKLADHPEEFAELAGTRFLYGSHPYGHESVGFPTSVKGIKRVDLQKLYGTLATPGNAVLAVVGQFDAEYRDAITKTFEAWKAETKPLAEIPDFPKFTGREILLVDRSDLSQAQVEIEMKGVERSIPDFLELRAALKILGEGFGSRLFEEIRVKRGLTYSIHSWFDPREKAGPLGIYTFTRTDKTSEIVNETLNTLEKFVNAGVTDAEVAETQALMRGQFPRILETPEGLGRQLLILNRYGISVDYLSHYLQNVRTLNKEKVNAAIKKHFDPANLRIAIYAPRAKTEEALKKIGHVEVKSYKEFLQ